MSWASRRQSKIIFGILLLIGIGGVIVVIPLLTQKPTCFDGKKNGNELGIDCGGACSLQCKEYTQDVSIKWARSYEITKGFYNAVSMIENQNFNSGVKKVTYKFRLYDENHVLVIERDGQTFIEPNKAVVVFEQQIPVGNSKPLYTTFEFTSPIVWYQTDPRYNDMVIEVSEQLFDPKDIKPRLSAILRNSSDKYVINTIDVYVVAYDVDGNAIQVGKTLVKSLAPREKKNIFIVWQKQFETPPLRFEIIPRYDSFTQTYPKNPVINR
jgi:hypothetical protein